MFPVAVLVAWIAMREDLDSGTPADVAAGRRLFVIISERFLIFVVEIIALELKSVVGAREAVKAVILLAPMAFKTKTRQM